MYQAQSISYQPGFHGPFSITETFIQLHPGMTITPALVTLLADLDRKQAEMYAKYDFNEAQGERTMRLVDADPAYHPEVTPPDPTMIDVEAMMKAFDAARVYLALRYHAPEHSRVERERLGLPTERDTSRD